MNTFQDDLNKGYTLVKSLKLNEAISLADESLQLYKTEEEQSASLNLKGEALLHAGHYSLASSCFFESLKLAQQNNNTSLIAEAYTGLSYVYRFLEDYQTAVDYANKSKACSGLQTDESFIKALISEGICNARLNHFEEAELILNKALQLSESRGDAYLTCTCIKSLADLFLNKKDYTHAIRLYEKALLTLKDSPHFVLRTMIMVRLGEALEQSGEPAKAIRYTEAGLEEARNNQFIAGERSAHYLLSKLFERESQTEKAFQHLKDYTYLKNSTDASVQTRKIHKMELAFVKETKDKEIALLQEIEEKHRSITQSISYAKGLQEAILPVSELNDTLLDYFVFFQPKEKVGGDFYRVDRNGEGYLFCVADCTGHGVPGAMLSMLCSNLVKQSIGGFNGKGLNEMLAGINRELHATFGNSSNLLTANDGMDIGLCAIEKDPLSGWTLRYSGANHTCIIIRGEEIVQAAYNRIGISLLTSRDYHFTETVYLIQKGDCIYLFSDGYPDQFGGTTLESQQAGGKKFKYKQLIELLKTHSHTPILSQQTVLKQTMQSWMGNLEQVDDMCLLGIKFKG